MRKLSALLLLLVLLPTRPALADDAASAREHYTRAANAYDLGHFAEAAKEFEAAYQLKNDPALLFNIGQAYRFDGKPRDALLAYRSYLRRLPNAPNRDSVEASMREMQDTLDKQKAEAAKPVTPPPTASSNEPSAPTPEALVATAAPKPAPTPVYKKWWLWTAVGGAVAIGLGVGLGVGLSGGRTAHTVPAVGGGL